MRMVFGLVLIVGIALAGFAVYMAKGYVGDYRTALAQERAARANMVQTVDIVIVNRQILYGERITREDIEVLRWPEDAVPEGAFTSVEEVFPEGASNFREAMRTIENDEALLAAKVTEPGDVAGITSQLEPGLRAFTVSVNASTGVSGFLRPGHRVDVYWSGRINEQEMTRLIESSVDVVAIDQSANEERDPTDIPRTVTVQVTPQQVAALAQAQTTGELSLSLVGSEDFSEINGLIEVDQAVLLGIAEQRVVQVQEERVCTARQRRGTEVIETVIPCSN